MDDFEEFSKTLKEINRKLRNLQIIHDRTGREINEINREIEKLEASTEESRRNRENKSKQRPIVEQVKKLTLSDCRKRIGHRVFILNPRSGDPNVGRIESVGDLYVTVRLPNQQTRQRIPKNLRLYHYE